MELLTALPTFVAEVTALDSGMLKNYPDGSGAAHVAGFVMWMGIILLVKTACAVMRKPKTDEEKAGVKRTLTALLGLWTVLPPLWFAAEYIYLYTPSGVAGSWEAFKYSQEMWAKLWAGVIALLGFRLLTMKDTDTDGEKKPEEEISKQLKDLDERLKKLEPK